MKLELLHCVGRDELRVHKQLSDAGALFSTPEKSALGAQGIRLGRKLGIVGGLGVGILHRETAERSNLGSLSSHVFHTHTLKQSPCHRIRPVKTLKIGQRSDSKTKTVP